MVFKCLTQTLPFPTNRSLETFCSGGAFPTEPLVAKKITAEGVSLLKKLLVVDPKDRLTAEATLDAGWLQISDYSFRSEMTASQEVLVKDHTVPAIIPEDRGSTISGQKSETSEPHVAVIQDALIGPRTLNVADTSTLGHKHHEDIGTQSQTPVQDTEGSTSKESDAMEKQDALNYPHTHGQEPASLTQNGKTSGKLQTLPPMLQKWDDKTPYQGPGFGEDSAVSGPRNSVSQINNQTSDVIKLTSSRGLNKSSTNGKALPLRPQDDKKQEGAAIVLHPDIASERAIQDVHATQFLLGNGFDIHADNFDANKALLWADARDPKGRMVQLLSEKGADVARGDNNGRKVLHMATLGRDEAAVRLLLEKGADVTADNHGLTLLHIAAWQGDEAMVRLLLEKEADIAAKANDNATALHLAACQGHEVVVRLLLEKGADIAAKTLLFAAWGGHEPVVQLLLENKAGVTADENGWTLLHIAAWQGDEAMVRLLLEKEADIAAKANDNATALYLAACRGHEVVVRLLLEKGADIAAKTDNKMTALLFAAGEGHEAVVRLLLEKRADIAAKGDNGMTALHLAAWYRHEAVVRLLLEKGADIAAKTDNRRTALHLAVCKGHEAVVRLLLEKGADIAAKGDNGMTALHFAAWQGREAAVRLLLEKGADIAAKGDNGMTALHFAAWYGHEAVVRLLLEKGADAAAKDGEMPALYLATKGGHEAVVQLLIPLTP
jgi:ankyrin repeat protein